MKIIKIQKNLIWNLGIAVALIAFIIFSISFMITSPTFVYANHTNESCFPCNDTDGGFNPWVKGTVFYLDENDTCQNETDYCLSSAFLVEYNCIGDDMINNSLVNCSVYGQICEDGACVNETTINETCPDCNDTDGGFNPWTKGTITYISSNGTCENATDYCLSDDILVEYECGPNSTFVNCTFYNQTCMDGACVNETCPACNDSDGGFNPFVKGTITFTSVNGTCDQLTDYCLDNFTLFEYFCFNGTTGQSLVNCFNLTNTTFCVDGACV